MEGWDEDESK
jgi:hypothetical protein